MTDPIADMLTRIRNANSAMFDSVSMPGSKLKESLARILHREGYIEGFDVRAAQGRPGTTLEIRLKYSTDRKRSIVGLKRVSTPDQRPKHRQQYEEREDAQPYRRPAVR